MHVAVSLWLRSPQDGYPSASVYHELVATLDTKDISFEAIATLDLHLGAAFKVQAVKKVAGEGDRSGRLISMEQRPPSSLATNGWTKGVTRPSNVANVAAKVLINNAVN